jgi:hypothetical protein
MADTPGPTEPSRPEWFAAFLADRGTRKPSAHTMKAYRQDFDAIAIFVAGTGHRFSRPSVRRNRRSTPRRGLGMARIANETKKPRRLAFSLALAGSVA